METKRDKMVKELTERLDIAKETGAIGRQKYLETLIEGVKNEFTPRFVDGKQTSDVFDNLDLCGCETMQLAWWDDFGDYVEENKNACYRSACEYADLEENKRKESTD
jgi:hypothetical protein